MKTLKRLGRDLFYITICVAIWAWVMIGIFSYISSGHL